MRRAGAPVALGQPLRLEQLIPAVGGITLPAAVGPQGVGAGGLGKAERVAWCGAQGAWCQQLARQQSKGLWVKARAGGYLQGRVVAMGGPHWRPPVGGAAPPWGGWEARQHLG